MEYRRLGRTGLHVSTVSLGTVEIGMDYGIQAAGDTARPVEVEAAKLLNAALDAGVNFIDTARDYGESEDVIGRALKNRRHEYVLASKISASGYLNLSGAALREGVRRSAHQTLRALQTDFVDVMYIHDASVEVVRRGEVLDVLCALRQEGQARFLGASTSDERESRAVLADGGFDCLQLAYSVLNRAAALEGEEGPSVLAVARERDVGVVARSVLLKGALTPRYKFLPDELRGLKSAVEKICALSGSTPETLPALAYRFVLAHEAVASALVGTSRISELREAVRYAEAGPLPGDLPDQLAQIDVPDPALLKPWNWPI